MRGSGISILRMDVQYDFIRSQSSQSYRRIKGAAQRVLFVLLLSSCVFQVPSATAVQVGSFSSTCMAPNWQTGSIEPVPDQNSVGPLGGLFGLTSRAPNGHWLIQFDVPAIRANGLTDDVIIFMFYHECGHAKGNTSDEHVADCIGLDDMNAAGLMSQPVFNQILQAYANRGRPFPSGGPC
jgi:hypothetical protein